MTLDVADRDRDTEHATSPGERSGYRGTDPGVGNATAMTVTPGPVRAAVSASINVCNWNEGTHDPAGCAPATLPATGAWSRTRRST